MADRWLERLKNHDLNSQISQTQSVIVSLLEEVELPQEQVDYLRRAENVLVNLTWRIERAEARLTPIQALNNAASQVQNARSELEQFASNRNQAHLENCDHRIDDALVQLRALPPLPFRVGEEVARGAAESYAERVEALEAGIRDRIRKLSEESTTLADALHPLRAQLNEVKAEADKKVTQVIEQIDGRVGEVREQLASQTARLDQLIEGETTQFTSREELRTQEFASSTVDRDAKSAQALTAIENRASESFSSFSAEAVALMESLRETENKAEEILAVSAASAVVGAYINEANDQRGEANVWRIVAFLVAGALLAGIVAPGVFSPPGTDLRATELLIYSSLRLPVGAVLAGAFTFAISQSGLHRERERDARKNAMLLTAFRPFLAELSKSDRDEQTKEFARSFFRTQEEPSQTKEETAGESDS